MPCWSSPPTSHGQGHRGRLKAGKHVLTERADVLSRCGEADEIVAAKNQAGTVCMVAYMKPARPRLPLCPTADPVA